MNRGQADCIGNVLLVGWELDPAIVLETDPLRASVQMHQQRCHAFASIATAGCGEVVVDYLFLTGGHVTS
jgi:hypothetical protein